MTNVISPEKFKRRKMGPVTSEPPHWETSKRRLCEFYGSKEGTRRFKVWHDAHIKYARRDLEETLSRARLFLGDDGVRELLKEATEHETANDN